MTSEWGSEMICSACEGAGQMYSDDLQTEVCYPCAGSFSRTRYNEYTPDQATAYLGVLSREMDQQLDSVEPAPVVAPQPQLLASDAQRDAAVELLCEAYVEGRIGVETMEERIWLALSAETTAALELALDQLPAEVPVEAVSAVAVAPVRSRLSLGQRIKAEWRLGTAALITLAASPASVGYGDYAGADAGLQMLMAIAGVISGGYLVTEGVAWMALKQARKSRPLESEAKQTLARSQASPGEVAVGQCHSCGHRSYSDWHGVCGYCDQFFHTKSLATASAC